MTAAPAAVRDRRFPTLNAVRAIGALMVLLTHVAFNTGQVVRGSFGAVLSRFDFGVALFFVLSGFLLARPFLLAVARAEQGPRVAHYLWKRALRILPLYWVVVAVALLIDPQNRDATAGDWLRNLTFTQIYAEGLPASSLTHMWSLATEVAFYLLLPVLVLVLAGRPRVGKELPLGRIYAILGVLCVLGVVWKALVAAYNDTDIPMHQWLPGFLPWFGGGMLLAAASADQHSGRTPRRFTTLLEGWGRDLPGCWLLAAALFAIACTPVAGPRTLDPASPWEAVVKSVLYAATALLLVLPLVFGPERSPARDLLAARVPHFLGEISYGIFAVHMFLLINLMSTLEIAEFTGYFTYVLAMVLVLTMAIATASFYGFESRFMRLKNAGPFRRRPATTSERASDIDAWPSS